MKKQNTDFINLEKKYARTIEILQELNKIKIDFIEDLNRTMIDLKKLGYKTYIEDNYLKLEFEIERLEDANNRIEKITQGETFIRLEQLEDLELIETVYVEGAGISGTGKGQLYVLYLTDFNGNKLDIEIEEVVLVVEKEIEEV